MIIPEERGGAGTAEKKTRDQVKELLRQLKLQIAEERGDPILPPPSPCPYQFGDYAPDFGTEGALKLMGSAISPQTAKQCAIQWLTAGDTLRHLLRNDFAQAPALVFPHHDADGNRVLVDDERTGEMLPYIVARVFPPLIFPNGSVAKYLTPTDTGYRAYIPSTKWFSEPIV